ncbi:hypothetical protein [Nonomuraea gerenzanensis]|uniref:Uncharacterized protein n=1 Tax=Nonomuraea gerenzanensis TaxID=93944 RepID=A0A1M4E9S3_9ACTN|nr:hypothetical protein [Nonomuraea gerenzanensis]UBU17718.1 hypothetical protein LCN96_22655 [Nonomuraea gerenzanensis]SBO95494.1 hypothetical protein BN4615_P5010 [Nonomuraea gerenzanensis]
MNNYRGLWVAVIVTAGLFVAFAGGGLAWLGGTPVPLAVLAGAAGFAGFVGLALAVMTFLTRAQD